MRVVLQRVKHASVTIDGKLFSEIGKGMLILLGIEDSDTQADIDWLCNKLVKLRIFEDGDNAMNLSISQVDGEFLIVSQFTLFATTKKGNRPGFTRAARPETAIPLYEKFIETLNQLYGKQSKTGVFGADMKVDLLNDGPVTIVMDTKNVE